MTAIRTADYHTGGEPFRTITGGVEPLRGATMLDRRRDALERLDHVRRLLVKEPRGHADMYGCHVVPPIDDGADLGVIFWQQDGELPLTQRNVTVFADGEVDRSPCGSGTSARLALLDAARQLPRGAELRHLSIVGSLFTGRVVGEVLLAGRPAVVTEVTGTAYKTGEASFVLEADDPLGEGFLLR